MGWACPCATIAMHVGEPQPSDRLLAEAAPVHCYMMPYSTGSINTSPETLSFPLKYRMVRMPERQRLRAVTGVDTILRDC